jgi:hypothetical protein
MDHERLLRGSESGIVATVAMSIPMMLGQLMGLSPMPKPFPKAVVETILGDDAPESVLTAGTVVSHLGYGGTFGALLSTFGRPVTVNKGLGVGAGLWAVMQVVFLPLVGWGAFGRKISGKIPVVTLLLHAVYGGTLGWLLGRYDEEAGVATEDSSAIGFTGERSI